MSNYFSKLLSSAHVISNIVHSVFNRNSFKIGSDRTLAREATKKMADQPVRHIVLGTHDFGQLVNQK